MTESLFQIGKQRFALMRFQFNSVRVYVGMMLAVCSLNICIGQTNQLREHLLLDANWKFHLGDDWPNALRLDKAGASSGPASEKFNDTAWRTLDLPHDWVIELPFDHNADKMHGYKPVGPGFPQNNIGWYRRTFELSKEDSGKRIWLTFDGVFRDATVWVNGWLVKRHEGGYTPFREDITDVLHYGGTNTVTVKVDASKFEGWFYEGAGIYRHVWLDKTGPVAITPAGIFVYSQFKNNVPSGRAEINVEAGLLNSAPKAVNATVGLEIISPEGKSVSKFKKSVQVKSATAETVKLQSKVSSPVLWSPESPRLYRLVTTVEVDGKPVDRKETEFGIRTFAFDKEKGFLLNGRPYSIKGTCNHQDMAGVGVALPDALQYFRVAKLKEFGCNAYRTAHNPPTAELLDACDRLGLLVMDEARLLGSDGENLGKWEEQIRADRNHASVGIWSIANEEFFVQSTAQGAAVAYAMQEFVKRLDPTRPVTYAAPQGDTFEGINGIIDVRGWNYRVGPLMDSYHAKHPDQANIGTEQASTVGTRGIYTNDAARGYVSAYDGKPLAGYSAENWWSYFAGRPWLSGAFVWTGFDYRGEPTPYGWPCISSHYGVLDVCGFPKDNFYYYQSWWTTNIVLHLLPHWNWPGREGQEIRVDALSNCREVELFLNGESLGKQSMKPNSKLTWQVKYEPGVLSAKGYNDGKLVAETKVETTGEPVAIQLTPNRSTINADGEDVSVFTVSVTDSQGRVVPTASNKIHFNLSGFGKIIGVGNGDPSCHEPDTFIAQPPVRSVPVDEWRWKLAKIPTKGASAPEYANDFDDSAWNTIKAKTGGDNEGRILKEGEMAFYRAHILLTKADLANPGVQIRFRGIDDQGWIFVNNRRVGGSADWTALPVDDIRLIDIKYALHLGDNVIAVGVLNESGRGGLNPDASVEFVGKSESPAWSRSVFNGLAQVLVKSTKTPGKITLAASADGLQPAASVIETQPCPLRPSVP